MSQTIIPVIYRDAAAYKAHTTYVADGAITDEQKTTLTGALHDGEFFIPMDLGYEHLGPQLDAWSETPFPGDDDHPWHELDVEDITVEGNGPTDGITVGTVSEFIAAMVAASTAGWNDGVEL